LRSLESALRICCRFMRALLPKSPAPHKLCPKHGWACQMRGFCYTGAR
jgi:hypothetical protein